MPFYWLALGLLGVWRVTHLLHAENGPSEVLARLRRRLAHTTIGRALECFYCLSVWVAIPFAWGIGESWRERFLLWLGLSGGAILLERVTARPRTQPLYYEDPEDSDVQLRQFK